MSPHLASNTRRLPAVVLAAALVVLTPVRAQSDASPAAWGERQALELLQAVGSPSAGAASVADSPAWLMLRQQLARSLQDHPEARASLASTQGARAATRETAAARRPQLSLEAETGHRDNDANELQGTSSRDWDTGSVGLNLRQQVWDGGTTQAQIEASTAFADGVEARGAARRADFALRAIQASLERVRARRLVEQARLHVQARDEIVVDLTRRHELGGGTLSDVWRARSRAVEARGALVQAEARLQSAEATCLELLGADVPAELDLRAPPLPDLTSVRASPATQMDLFAAVQAAQAAVRTAEHELEVARRRDGPRVDLDAGISRRDLIGGRRAGTDWQAGLTLRHSFYVGGADDARIAQARARLDEASEQLRGTRLQLERSLRQALADDQIGEPLLDARREGVKLAVDALRGVREQFAFRRGSLLDVMSAQDTLHAAGTAWVEAEHNRALTRWRIAYFTGSLMPWIGLAP
ncbi:TolC family protein [Sphaerotilus mobilis]|uniref:Outer membrane protein TolC n=1 Tax=Sphaerotilus mobilis TaxID=47994 RepID=A0A4Q7LGV9_9BURK|nr:TolC family protein [Sphaerotilus mobilis]RZS53263.1 outer membrane protein TolC [Sphaerotilus mobilis]